MGAEVGGPGLSMPVLPVPHAVTGSTGVFLFDTLCIWTMGACLPTLILYYRKGRYGDLAIFGVGFLLAVIYHGSQLDPEGLTNSEFLGLGGATWRTLDVIWAQWLLTRTFGHAIGASHLLTKGTCNGGFPAVVLHHAVTGMQLSMKVCIAALLATCLGALAIKALLEGLHTLPRYKPGAKRRILSYFIMAFVFFPLPEQFPSLYWLFHSLWHLCVAVAFYELYMCLEGEEVRYGQLWEWASTRMSWGALRFDAILVQLGFLWTSSSPLSCSQKGDCLLQQAQGSRMWESPRPSSSPLSPSFPLASSAAITRRSLEVSSWQAREAGQLQHSGGILGTCPDPARDPWDGCLPGESRRYSAGPRGSEVVPHMSGREHGRGLLLYDVRRSLAACYGGGPPEGVPLRAGDRRSGSPVLPRLPWGALPQGLRSVGRSGRAAGSRVVRWSRQWVDPRGTADAGGPCTDEGSADGARQWLFKGVDAAKVLSWMRYRQGGVEM